MIRCKPALKYIFSLPKLHIMVRSQSIPLISYHPFSIFNFCNSSVNRLNLYIRFYYQYLDIILGLCLSCWLSIIWLLSLSVKLLFLDPVATSFLVLFTVYVCDFRAISFVLKYYIYFLIVVIVDGYFDSIPFHLLTINP